MTTAFATVDGALGQVVERLTTSRHRRRLRKVGWEEAMDSRPGRWANGDPPPRPGNTLDVLIDGKEAFARVVEDIRAAHSYVHITGWHVTPGFDLTRDGKPTELRKLLIELAHHVPVRVLVWAGAPLPLLRPWRGDVRKIKAELDAGNPIQCVLDRRERPFHCHSETTNRIDDRGDVVGGFDLT